MQSVKSNHYTKIWIWAILFFLIVAIGWLFYWVVWGQFKEKTNDAYVNGNMIVIKPFEKGIVVSILADNAQMVAKGQPLVELNRHDFEIALGKAKADLAQAVRDVVQMFLKTEELSSKMKVFEAKVARARVDYEHRADLVEDGSVSREDFEHSELDFAAALAALAETEKEWAEAVAEIQNTTPFTHPRVEMAKAAVKKSYLALHRCTVLAPTSGIITQRNVQVGQWVEAAEPLMALVPLEEIWVDANFREVELKNIRIGQPVKLIADMYGQDTIFRGRIAGLNPGTGSVFSILPPQNATGNWIKIIQRVPVKINLNGEELKERPLVLGLSMTVTIDTHDRSGARLPATKMNRPIYQTDIYANELKGVDEMIQEILTQNCSCNLS
ncbi:MAG TPA: HlyD family efflux transporter periplasmic adaptor subunit [Chlamydiales bacterium]|nr:HlyD family efflux transporter periplasmic adaptor subunit [Chlamydiales bacterium]